MWLLAICQIDKKYNKLDAHEYETQADGNIHGQFLFVKYCSVLSQIWMKFEILPIVSLIYFGRKIKAIFHPKYGSFPNDIGPICKSITAFVWP